MSGEMSSRAWSVSRAEFSILVNNAGIVGTYEGIETVSLDDYNRVIALNQTGVFLGMRHCAPLMRKGGSGSIINISSIWGLVGAPGVAPYQASKGAVTLMTRNAAMTFAPAIRANSIHPGIIWTPLIERQDPAISQSLVDVTPLGRMGQPREIAYAALFLASDESSYVQEPSWWLTADTRRTDQSLGNEALSSPGRGRALHSVVAAEVFEFCVEPTLLLRTTEGPHHELPQPFI